MKITTVTFPCGHTYEAWHPFKLLIVELILIVQKLMYHNLACNSHTRLFFISIKVAFLSKILPTLSVKLQPGLQWELLTDLVWQMPWQTIIVSIWCFMIQSSCKWVKVSISDTQHWRTVFLKQPHTHSEEGLKLRCGQTEQWWQSGVSPRKCIVWQTTIDRWAILFLAMLVAWYNGRYWQCDCPRIRVYSIAVKSCTVIHGHQRMNSADFGNASTFHVARLKTTGIELAVSIYDKANNVSISLSCALCLVLIGKY